MNERDVIYDRLSEVPSEWAAAYAADDLLALRDIATDALQMIDRWLWLTEAAPLAPAE